MILYEPAFKFCKSFYFQFMFRNCFYSARFFFFEAKAMAIKIANFPSVVTIVGKVVKKKVFCEIKAIK